MSDNATSPRWQIIGLGWLGQALFDQLKADGLTVMGTRRAQCDLLKDELPDAPCDVLFLNTPPLVELAPAAFAQKILKISAKRIIFISSTSVYGMSAGEVDEASVPQPDTPGGSWLFAVENELRKLLGPKLLVIRPGGLIGGERHPVKFLAARFGVNGGNERVNLIHREDLIGIIRSCPENIQVVNAISPFHPTKAEYYTGWARKLSLTPPEFFESPHFTRLIHSQVLESFYHNWRCRELDWI